MPGQHDRLGPCRGQDALPDDLSVGNAAADRHLGLRGCGRLEGDHDLAALSAHPGTTSRSEEGASEEP